MMTTVAKSLAGVVHLMARVFAVISLLGTAAVLVLVNYDVLMRQLDQPGFKGLVEYVEIAMALAVFFALGESERRRSHVSVDVFLRRLKGRSYVVLRSAGGLLAAAVAVLLAFASWQMLAESLATGEYKLGLVSIPMWPARAAVFGGFLVLALEQLITAVEDVRSRGEDQGDEIVVVEGQAL